MFVNPPLFWQLSYDITATIHCFHTLEKSGRDPCYQYVIKYGTIHQTNILSSSKKTLTISPVIRVCMSRAPSLKMLLKFHITYDIHALSNSLSCFESMLSEINSCICYALRYKFRCLRVCSITFFIHFNKIIVSRQEWLAGNAMNQAEHKNHNQFNFQPYLFVSYFYN